MEVEQAAIDHLRAKDGHTALSHYTQDAIAVSNTTLFRSLADLAVDVNGYYDALKDVNLATWDELLVSVIDADAALVTGRFNFSFTNTSDERTDLEGIWTALYVRRDGKWKIRVRHESFAPVKG